MKTMQEQQSVYDDFEEYEKNCYFFSPAIGRRKTIGGKSYFVRGYFRGGRDFESTMKKLAVKQAADKKTR